MAPNGVESSGSGGLHRSVRMVAATADSAVEVEVLGRTLLEPQAVVVGRVL